MTENYKDVVISGRTFRIKKFGAKTGAFMAIKITGLLAPLVKNIDFGKLKEVKDISEVDTGAFNLSGIMDGLGSLSEQDFNYIQDKCLQVCSEVLPAGVAPVLKTDGTFGVTGLDEDTMTVLALTVHTIMFNVKGFFSGSPLASFLGGLSITSQQN
jgi:hypothetical protein